MRALGIALLAGAVFAEPDALRAWKGEMHRIEGAEREYWRDFQGAVTQALIGFREPVQRAERDRDANREVTWDYGPFRSLYSPYRAFAESRAEADRALAASGHEKAASTLFGELLDVAKRADALDEELQKATPKLGAYIMDQRLGVERHGLALRTDALVDALAKCPDAAPFLVDAAWKRAEKADGKRSILRRVAVVDAAALTADARARPALEALLADPCAAVRIAAIEGLMRHGKESRAALEPLLLDPSPVVRRALVQEIRARAPADGAWIEPVLRLFGETGGRQREDCLLALEALTRQTFGHDPKAWQDWLEIYRQEIAEGRFDREKVEVQEAARAAPKEVVSFYGVETLSRAVVFVVEGSQHVHMPAEWEVERTRYRDEWPPTRNQWEAQSPSHQSVLVREFGRTMSRFPADASFAVIAVWDGFSASVEGEKELLRPVPRDVRRAEKILGRLPDSPWASPMFGLREAARIGGMPVGDEAAFAAPAVDTVYLFSTGDPRGDWYMTPEATLDAFRRFNRFRRLVVHAIRISDRKEPAETLMKGLAEASGGTYLWAAKPPPE